MYYLTNNQFHSIFNSGYRPDIRHEVTKQISTDCQCKLKIINKVEEKIKIIDHHYKDGYVPYRTVTKILKQIVNSL